MADPLPAAARWPAFVGPTWAETDLDAVAHNVRAVLALLPKTCRLMAVVKADAYGHGAVEVGRACIDAGAAALGVSTIAEGLQLRESGLAAPVLVFTPLDPAEMPAAIDLDLTATVVDLAGARALAAAAGPSRTAVAHLKCDTGMGRYGWSAADLEASAPELLRLGTSVRWEGIYTHFARAGEARQSRAQLDRLLAAAAGCERAGLQFSVRHAASSRAVVALPDAHLDMVRVGGLLYGDAPPAQGLRRAFTLRSRVTQVRDLPSGTSVGYGGEWRVPAGAPARVATLPVGWADGLGVSPSAPFRRPAVLLRALARAFLRGLGLARGAEAGEITLGGRVLPALGRIGMQQVTVGCRGLAVAPGDVATVHVPPTSVSERVARVFVRDGVPVLARSPLGVAVPLDAGAVDRGEA